MRIYILNFAHNKKYILFGFYLNDTKIIIQFSGNTLLYEEITIAKNKNEIVANNTSKIERQA